MNNTVTEIELLTSGGILYKNSAGEIIATGSQLDRARPYKGFDPALTQTYILEFCSTNKDITLLGKANGSISWTIKTPSATFTGNYTIFQVMDLLAQNIYKI